MVRGLAGDPAVRDPHLGKLAMAWIVILFTKTQEYRKVRLKED